jgi:hypothetical protein
MGRHAEVDGPASILRKHHKNEEQPERRRRYDEEVGRGQVFHVVLQKGLPALRRRFPMSDHVLRYSPLRHFNTQLEQLAVDAGRAPAWIGKTHPADEISDLLGYRRSAVRKSALPSPVEAKALPVPSDDGFRFHDQEGRAPTGPRAGEPYPEHTVGRIQFEPMVSVSAL